MKNAKVFVLLLTMAGILLSCSGKKGAADAGEGDYYNETFAKRVSISWFGGNNAPLEDNSWGELTIEKLFNVDLTVIRADSTEAVAALFASGNIPDYTIETMGGIAAMDSMGVIGEIPIEKIKEFMPAQYQNGISMDPNVFTYSMINGRNLAVPRFAYNASAYLPAVRADWLKATGKPIPKTLQEYEDVMLAFRNNDPDGNGRKDTYGMSSFMNTGDPRYFASTFGAFGVNPFFWRLANNGEVEFGFVTDDFVKGLKTLRRWYQMELIDPEFITQELRTSGQDIAYKFSNGRIGIMESYHCEDYQVDNDGHVSAKWTTAHENWRKYYDDNAGNAEELYKFDVPTDFVDNMLDPYYIVLNPPIGPDGRSGVYMDGVIATRLCIGKQVENDPDKLERILRILEVMVVDPDVKAYYLGPEEHGQWMFTADGTRVMNPKMTESEWYHPQGIKNGVGWFLFPMWSNDKLSVELIGGPKNVQRYVRTLPLFKNRPVINNVVQGVLPSMTEYYDLTHEYVSSYISQAIRGDVDIDATYPRMKADWFARGGSQLTKEANEWYKSSRQ